MPADYTGTHMTQEELDAEEARLAGVIARKGWPEPTAPAPSLAERIAELLAVMAKMTPGELKRGPDVTEQFDGCEYQAATIMLGKTRVAVVNGRAFDSPESLSCFVAGIIALRNSEALLREAALAAGELEELRRWKAEGLAVERTWDVQAVGTAIGVGLGGSILPAILPAINALKADNERLRGELDAIHAARGEGPPPNTAPTDGAPARVMLDGVLRCVRAWESGARLLGNVRARDIERAVIEVCSDNERLQAEVSDLRRIANNALEKAC